MAHTTTTNLAADMQVYYDKLAQQMLNQNFVIQSNPTGSNKMIQFNRYSPPSTLDLRSRAVENLHDFTSLIERDRPRGIRIEKVLLTPLQFAELMCDQEAHDKTIFPLQTNSTTCRLLDIEIEIEDA